MYHCIPYDNFKACADGVRFDLRLSAFKNLKKQADGKNIEYTVEKRSGLPAFLDRYKYRFGIWIGILCAVTLIVLSQAYVWDIEVTGNTQMTSAEVRQMLAEYGFGVGSNIKKTNTDRIENRILIDSERISWISINIIGTVAEVQIRENASADRGETVTRPANLIAAKAGVIEEVRIYRGNVVVSSGKYVEKGDLLVSGLYDSSIDGFRYTRAAGEVLARTTTEYCVEIPYEYQKTVYTGEEYCDKYLNFFDYSINILKKGRKEGVFYDKIDMVENYSFYDGTQTPFSLHTVKYLEYITETCQRSASEAEELAYFELAERLEEASSDSVLVKKTITPYVMEDRFILYCTVVSIENIAEVSEFEVNMDIVGESTD